MNITGFRPAPGLDFVVPCYNEEACISSLLESLDALTKDLIATGRVTGKPRLICIDDGSSDKTWELIEAAAQDQSRTLRVKGVKLSRNQGHQRALFAGLMTADADVTVSLDADLQDDVEAVGKMIDSYRAGAEIVFGVRRSRKVDSWFKRSTARGYYAVLRGLGVDIVPDHADFRLMSRQALQALGEHREVNLFLRGLVRSLGFPTAIVTYDRAERVAGETKYPLGKMVLLAIEGITSFSTRPLRYVTLMGFLIAAFSLGYIAYAVIGRLMGVTVSGWASIVSSIYLLGGVQLIALGIFGEYLGKIYIETKRRPQYLIERTVPDPADETDKGDTGDKAT